MLVPQQPSLTGGPVTIDSPTTDPVRVRASLDAPIQLTRTDEVRLLLTRSAGQIVGLARTAQHLWGNHAALRRAGRSCEVALDTMRSNGVREADNPLYFVRDAGTEWHIAADNGFLPAHQSWTLCGRWPSWNREWKEATTDGAAVAIHDTCRYWAHIGGPWLYVRAHASNVYHVVSGLAEEPTRASALCGDAPDRGWLALVDRPIGLTLHDACRAQRDQLDLEQRQCQLLATCTGQLHRAVR